MLAPKYMMMWKMPLGMVCPGRCTLVKMESITQVGMVMRHMIG